MPPAPIRAVISYGPMRLPGPTAIRGGFYTCGRAPRLRTVLRSRNAAARLTENSFMFPPNAASALELDTCEGATNQFRSAGCIALRTRNGARACLTREATLLTPASRQPDTRSG